MSRNNRTGSSKNNKLDQGIELFVRQYKYEILSSLVLVSLLGGILFATKLTQQPQEEISLESTQEQKEPQEVLVDVQGAIAKPGVYTLEQGSRVKDVLEEAGGFTESVDTSWVESSLNQAEVLRDGQKLFIPSQKPQENRSSQVEGVEKTNAAQSNKVNLNTASISELESLPGIGPTYAQRIIEARPFSSVEELQQISGIGSKRYQQIKEKVSLY